MKKELKTRS